MMARLVVCLSLVLLGCASARSRDPGRSTDAHTADASVAGCPVSIIALIAEEQVEGDCKKLFCEDGEIHAKDDDSDAPRGDGNPCHIVSCTDGGMRVSNMDDGTACNTSGTCQGGRCSVCQGGQECTRSSDCTFFVTRCVDGMLVCEDTHVPRQGPACQSR